MSSLQTSTRRFQIADARWMSGLEVPAEWTRTRVKNLVDEMRAGDAIAVDAIGREGAYPVYGANGLRGFTSQSNHRGTHVLIGRQGALCGNVHLVAGEFWASEHAIVVSAGPGVDGRWLAMLLEVMDLGQYSTSAAQPGIGVGQVAPLHVYVPPLGEQRAIADYLDQETAQIDALVAKQADFIGLLRERRSGLIADGVMGRKAGEAIAGNASWLGSPPAGWKLGRVKHFGVVTLGKMLQSEDTGGDVLAPYMRAANVQPDGVLSLDDTKSMWFNPRELRVLDLRAGDVVVVEGGIGGYGRAAFIDEPLGGWGFQNSINRVRPRFEYDGRYLTYFLLMARQKGFIKVYCNIVSMPHLTADKLEAMPMFLPPPDEQRRIADHLDEQTARIDALIAKAEEHIALAKERRSALITAAVTGQIDVRTARKAS